MSQPVNEKIVFRNEPLSEFHREGRHVSTVLEAEMYRDNLSLTRHPLLNNVLRARWKRERACVP